MHYYQFNIGDYRKDTGHLSLLEHGVYRQLLDWYYLSEEPIPEETDLVLRRLCARTEDEKKAVFYILKEFFFVENGYQNKRANNEISAYKAKADRARNNGKLGGRRPKTKEVISGNQEETQSEPREKLTNKPINQLTNNKEKINKKENPVADAPKFLAIEFLINLGVSEEVAKDWVAHRKAKKSIISERVITSIDVEAKKAGLTLEAALLVIVGNGWTGFKAEWVKARERPKEKFNPRDYYKKQQQEFLEAKINEQKTIDADSFLLDGTEARWEDADGSPF